MLIINIVKDRAGMYTRKIEMAFEEICNLLNGILEFHMEHIYRECNSVVDDLAKVGHNVEGIKE